MDAVTLGLARAQAKRDAAALYGPNAPRALRGIVTGGCHAMPNVTLSSAATHRVPYLVTADCADLVLEYVNYGRNTAGNGAGDLDNATTLTLVVVVEDPTDSTVQYPVTFNGRTSGTLDPGAALRADPVGLDLTAGTVVWVRTYVSGGTYYCNRGNSQFEGSGLTGGGGYVTGASLTTGTIADAEQSLFGPAAVYGSKATSLPGVIISGDSIPSGLQDGNGAGGSINTGLKGGGWAERAFHGQRGIVNISSASERGEDFVKNARHFRRSRWITPGTWLLSCYGRNDISANRTATVMRATMIKLWQMGTRRGAKVAAATITPLTSSTDSWATVANQSQPNAASEAVRVEINDWLRDGAPILNGVGVATGSTAAGTLRAGTAGHPLSLVVDVADQVETARNSGLWKANFTSDGTHPRVAGHQAMAAVVPVASFV